jgi:ubiquinone/menaquinone biosynthesis C-methylase UbiE
MGIKLGGKLGRLLLQAICKRPPDDLKPTWALDLQLAVELDPSGIPKLQRRLGVGIWDELRDRSVLDFGCGWGEDAVAAAVRGARLVIGVDVQEHRLEAGRALAAAKGVSDRCLFINAHTQAAELASLPMVDVVYALDSFEHFDDPKGVLSQMYGLLAPGGRLLVVFGPPWKNPYGSHLEMMSSVPWIHLLFTEETVMAMRARFRADGARTYAECPGGLNGMTVRRFHELVIESGFQIEHLRTVPLSTAYTNSTGLWMRIFRTRWLVEYCTSIVIARAIRPFDEPTDPCPKPTTTDTKAEIEGATAHAICSASAAQYPRQDPQLQAPSALA